MDLGKLKDGAKSMARKASMTGESGVEALKNTGAKAKKSFVSLTGKKDNGEGEDEVKPVIKKNLSEDSFVSIAKNLKKSCELLDLLSVSQFTSGIYLLAKRHQREGLTDTISGSCVKQRELQELQTYFGWVNATYQEDITGVCSLGGFAPEDVIHHSKDSKVNRPAYYIAKVPSSKTLVFGIRGTSCFKDMVTDLESNAVQFKEGDVHAGFMAAAKLFMEDVTPLIVSLLNSNINKGYTLHIVGHSLGAGVASIYTLLLVNEPSVQSIIPASTVRCTALATPACMSDDLCTSLAQHVTTVVYQDDIIPRLSIANLHFLQLECLYTNWQEDLEDGCKKKEALIALNNARQQVSKSSQSFNDSMYKFVEGYNPRTPVGAYLKAAYVKKGQSGENGDGSEAPDGADADADADTPPPDSPTWTARGPKASVHYAPGRLIHLTQESSDEDSSSCEYKAVLGSEGQFFKRIVLSPTMISDHGLVPYFTALDWLIQNDGGGKASLMDDLKDKFQDTLAKFMD